MRDSGDFGRRKRRHVDVDGVVVGVVTDGEDIAEDSEDDSLTEERR